MCGDSWRRSGQLKKTQTGKEGLASQSAANNQTMLQRSLIRNPLRGARERGKNEHPGQTDDLEKALCK